MHAIERSVRSLSLLSSSYSCELQAHALILGALHELPDSVDTDSYISSIRCADPDVIFSSVSCIFWIAVVRTRVCSPFDPLSGFRDEEIDAERL